MYIDFGSKFNRLNTNDNDSTQNMAVILPRDNYDSFRYAAGYSSIFERSNRIKLTGAIPNASTDGIKYNLARLQQIGVLKRVGSTRYGHWEVV